MKILYQHSGSTAGSPHFSELLHNNGLILRPFCDGNHLSLLADGICSCTLELAAVDTTFLVGLQMLGVSSNV
jgi:hypothetical protein